MLPLPTTKAEFDGAMLHPWSAGAYGEILPRARFDAFPIATEGTFPEFLDQLYGELAVLSARIDPCFPKTAEDTTCTPQLRLIMQPVVIIENFTFAIDAVYHLFYDLSAPEMRSLVRDMADWKLASPVDTTGLPLGVHPGVAAAGLASPYGQAFHDIVLRYAGAHNLSRIAIAVEEIRVLDPEATKAQLLWRFEARDIVAGQLVSASITDVNGPVQNIVDGFVFDIPGVVPGAEDFGAIVEPVLDQPLANLLKPREEVEHLQADVFSEAMAAAMQIDNPDYHNAHSVDCVSCHMATKAAFLGAFYQGVDIREHEDRFDVAPYNGTLTSRHLNDFDVVRAFGYLGTEPAIIQRTVNESAVVARELSAWRP
jgi:hypothetical protein